MTTTDMGGPGEGEPAHTGVETGPPGGTHEASASEVAAESARLRARLVALTNGADTLLAAVHTGSVPAAICDLARQVSGADAFAICALGPSSGQGRIVHSAGLSESFTSQILEGSTVRFSGPLVVSDIERAPMPDHRRRAYRAEGIRAFVSVPLPVRGEHGATLVFYHRTPKQIPEGEVQVAVALGHLAAAVIGHAESFDEERRLRSEAQRQASRLAFLADSSTLFTSLDYETTLRQVAQMSVPVHSDWCTVDILTGGQVERLATAHVDPAKVKVAEALLAKYPRNLAEDAGIGRVLRSGQPLLLPVLTDEIIADGVRDPEQLASLRALEIRSVMIAPLNARGRTLGTITWVSSTPGRHFNEADLALLMDLAGRAAMAIDNARLYAEAHEASRVKDEFLAVVSHELRTPLNTILGWSTTLLASSHEGPVLRRALETIERNARTQAQLVDDLLNFARLGSGQLEMRREVIDVRATLSSLAAEIRPVAERRNIALVVRLPDEPCPIDADPQRVRQILSNVLSNALKFTERSGRVELSVQSGPGQVEITVADTGIGISPEFLPHVFERFRQGDPSSTRRHGGVGLGLAIAKELTERMDGAISAQSEGAARGSTFVVTFPCARSAADRVRGAD
jgi:signal transduction histidine kinase